MSDFDSSFYDSIASSITSDFWEEPYQTEVFDTPIEYTLSFNWQDNTGKINETHPSKPPESLTSNESIESSDSSSYNHCIETTPLPIDIPRIDDITFEQLENLIFTTEPDKPLPCIDENDLSDLLEFIEKDLKRPMEMVRSKVIEKQFNCIACNKSFTSRPGIRKHFNTRRHKETVAVSGEADPVTMPETWTKATYSCFVCGKGFAKYSNMIDHVTTH